MNENTAAFVAVHRHDDVRELALRYGNAQGRQTTTDDVDLPFALDQIAGWQTAQKKKKKLPTWAATDGIIYPPHLNMEQCSSEATARYKERLGERLGDGLLVDLTGGFGVDFAFMASHFRHAIYVERDERLCAMAQHNFEVLGLNNVEVVCADATTFLHERLSPLPVGGRLIYLDPARRDANGHKVSGIEDCTPDVHAMKDELLGRADHVMIKLSPMLDWHAAAKAFDGSCREVHIVSVGNECKELLLVLGRGAAPLRLVCANDEQRFQCLPDAHARLRLADSLQARFLYVPNASVMKAGAYAQLTVAYPVAMVDTNSHLFMGDEDVEDFPGRKLALLATTTMNKRELRQKLAGVGKANVAVRNFPMSAVELKKRLGVEDGGDVYIFGTTMRGRHVLLIAEARNSG